MAEKTLQQHGLERKRLPKVIRAEAKVRTQAFKKALRMGDNSVSIEAVFLLLFALFYFTRGKCDPSADTDLSGDGFRHLERPHIIQFWQDKRPVKVLKRQMISEVLKAMAGFCGSARSGAS